MEPIQMTQSKYVELDRGYGTNGYAAIPALPGDNSAYVGGCQVAENGAATVVLRNLRADRRGVFVKIDQQGQWDKTFGESGYKHVDHPGSDYFGYLEFFDLIKVPAAEGGGYLAMSYPEIPVSDREGQTGQAKHIALSRFNDDLDLVSGFGKAGVAMPVYDARLYGGWEASITDGEAVERSDPKGAGQSRGKCFSIADGKFRTVHSAHVRTNGFTFYSPFVVEVDVKSGATTTMPLADTDIGYPSGEYGAHDFVFLDDGRIIVAGALGPDGKGGGIIVAYHPDGSVDRSFGRKNEKYGYVAYARSPARIWLDENGTFLVLAEQMLHRLLSTGEVDETYGPGPGFVIAGTFGSGLQDGDALIVSTYESDFPLQLQRRVEKGIDDAFAEGGSYLHTEHVETDGGFKVGNGIVYRVQPTDFASTGLLRLLWSSAS